MTIRRTTRRFIKHRTKKYFDDNRLAIEADIKVLGVGKALKKWSIASGTFSGISRRWKEADKKANPAGKSTEEITEPESSRDGIVVIIVAEVTDPTTKTRELIEALQNTLRKKRVLRT